VARIPRGEAEHECAFLLFPQQLLCCVRGHLSKEPPAAY
jgi:hypothetical protein